jgi:uroporphyrinogen-III decarboxylase
MKSRERILAAMQGQPVDRIPFVPNLNGYVIRSWPEQYQLMQRWEILKELGIDLLVRSRVGARVRPQTVLWPPPDGPITLASSATRDWANSLPATDKIKITTESRDGNVYVIEETPLGCLRAGWHFTPECPDIPFPIEFPLKTIADVDVFRYVLDHTVLEPNYHDILEALAGVGDEGTCEAAGGASPIQELIQLQMGMENFYYFMADYPTQMAGLMGQMLELRKREYRILAQSPAPIIITGENTSTTLSSPAHMAQWEFPALNQYSEIAHQKGKIHMVHMCGKLHQITGLLAEASFDGIHDVAPAPTGDFNFASDFRKVSSAGKCVAGGIDCTAIVSLSPPAIEDYVARLLDEVAPGTRFLASCGDTVPFGTPMENLRAVVRALEAHGS